LTHVDPKLYIKCSPYDPFFLQTKVPNTHSPNLFLVPFKSLNTHERDEKKIRRKKTKEKDKNKQQENKNKEKNKKKQPSRETRKGK
jgi:hypothetical protein